MSPVEERLIGIFAFRRRCVELLDEVTVGHRVVVMRRGKPVAMLVDKSEFDAMNETIAVLSHADHVRRMSAQEACRDYS